MHEQFGIQYLATAGEDVGKDFCVTCQKSVNHSPVLLFSQESTVYKNVLFCDTCSSIGDTLQKLHYFPARYGAVRYLYAFSNDVLELYRTLSLYTGISMYKFIKCVLSLQPPLASPFTEKMIYRAFTQVSVEYRRARLTMLDCKICSHAVAVAHDLASRAVFISQLMETFQRLGIIAKTKTWM